MKNKIKYKSIFVKSLSLKNKKFSENSTYDDIPEWDSMSHMVLISNLENDFNINIKPNDMIDFKSYKKGIKILKKYKIKI
ncbi:acyl carrier protein [Candidatus Pelagibacter sp.]|nr:acyl carrier protein [Candidatus Pelagibacter sp.]